MHHRPISHWFKRLATTLQQVRRAYCPAEVAFSTLVALLAFADMRRDNQMSRLSYLFVAFVARRF